MSKERNDYAWRIGEEVFSAKGTLRGRRGKHISKLIRYMVMAYQGK